MSSLPQLRLRDGCYRIATKICTIIILTEIMYYVNRQLLQSLVLSHCIPTLAWYLWIINS